MTSKLYIILFIFIFRRDFPHSNIYYTYLAFFKDSHMYCISLSLSLFLIPLTHPHLENFHVVNNDSPIKISLLSIWMTFFIRTYLVFLLVIRMFSNVSFRRKKMISFEIKLYIGDVLDIQVNVEISST